MTKKSCPPQEDSLQAISGNNAEIFGRVYSRVFIGIPVTKIRLPLAEKSGNKAEANCPSISNQYIDNQQFNNKIAYGKITHPKRQKTNESKQCISYPTIDILIKRQYFSYKSFYMGKSILQIVPALCLVLVVASCTKEDTYNGPCGDKKTWKAHKETLAIVYSSLNPADSTNTVIFEDLSEPLDICPDEHGSVTFSVTPNATMYTTWTGKAYWGGFYRDTVHLGFTDTSHSENNVVTSGFEIGFKQAYPNGPAGVGLQIIAKFKTTGYDSLDRIMIKEEIKTADITFDYRVYKP